MTGDLRTPQYRECQECGREERWDDGADTWRIRVDDDDKRVGDPFCVHEWDINGSFSAFVDGPDR